MFATSSLAARIERAECSMLIDLAQGASARLTSDERVLSSVGGGVALYLGPESPVNKLAGLGFGPPPTGNELDEVERAFSDRGAALQVEFSSLGDPAVSRVLTNRYFGFSLLYVRAILVKPAPVEPTR